VVEIFNGNIEEARCKLVKTMLAEIYHLLMTRIEDKHKRASSLDQSICSRILSKFEKYKDNVRFWRLVGLEMVITMLFMRAKSFIVHINSSTCSCKG